MLGAVGELSQDTARSSALKSQHWQGTQVCEPSPATAKIAREQEAGFGSGSGIQTQALQDGWNVGTPSGILTTVPNVPLK